MSSDTQCVYIFKGTKWHTWKVPPVWTWRSPSCSSPRARGGCAPVTRAASGCNEGSEAASEERASASQRALSNCLCRTTGLHSKPCKVEMFKGVENRVKSLDFSGRATLKQCPGFFGRKALRSSLRWKTFAPSLGRELIVNYPGNINLKQRFDDISDLVSSL